MTVCYRVTGVFCGNSARSESKPVCCRSAGRVTGKADVKRGVNIENDYTANAAVTRSLGTPVCGDICTNLLLVQQHC